MRISIVTPDNMIVVDGKAGKSDCKELFEQGISAVQWLGDQGEVEYVGHTKPNQAINDFGPFQKFVAAIEYPPPPLEPEEMGINA